MLRSVIHRRQQTFFVLIVVALVFICVVYAAFVGVVEPKKIVENLQIVKSTQNVNAESQLRFNELEKILENLQILNSAQTVKEENKTDRLAVDLSQVYKEILNRSEPKACELNKKPVTVKYDGPINKDQLITFSDPTQYQGPIVKGWGPNVSREVSLYVRPTENTVLLEPKNLGGDSNWCSTTKLLIFQHSRPEAFANRLDNRRTWMNYMREQNHIKAIFVVGIPSGEKSAEIQERIESEHDLYGDILQVDYIEHANNNTLKTLNAFKYILNLDWNKNFPEFVMKTDDDVYLNLPMLGQILFPENSDSKIPKDKIPLMGFLFVLSGVMTIEVIFLFNSETMNFKQKKKKVGF